MTVNESSSTSDVAAGDVVLVNFPATHGGEAKIRPSVVIAVSGNPVHPREAACLVVPATSAAKPEGTVGSVQVSEWRAAGLDRPSVLVWRRVFGIQATNVLSTLGRVSPETLEELRTLVQEFVREAGPA